MTVLYGTSSSVSQTVLPIINGLPSSPGPTASSVSAVAVEKGGGASPASKRISAPEGPPGNVFLPFDVKTCLKLLDVRCDVKPPIWELEQDVPWLDGVRRETLAVVGSGDFPFSCAGGIEVSLLRQAQGIAEQGA